MSLSSLTAGSVALAQVTITLTKEPGIVEIPIYVIVAPIAGAILLIIILVVILYFVSFYITHT